MTNTFIIYFNRHVSGKILLSSDLITFDESSNSINLANYILDENHFYVSKSENTLTIEGLDDNYDLIDKTLITLNDFDIALIRIVNADFVMFENYFIIKEDLTVDCSNSNKLINVKGKYLYIVYYKGKENHKEGNDNNIQNG